MPRFGKARRVVACLWLGLVLTLWSGAARAQSALALEVVPVLGASSPSVDGWGELYVRLENTGDQALSGFLELRAESLSRGAIGGAPHGSGRALSRAPFAVAGKSRVTLLLPSHSLVSRMAEARVLALDAKGNELTSERLAPLRTLDPLLFDLSDPSRIAVALNAAAMPIKRRAYGYAYGGATLSVATPQRNPTTGELVVPDLAAGYASATVVLATGRTLSTLAPAARDALFSWVLGGGALAVVIDRPEDLHTPWLEALAGGHVRSTAAARQLAQITQFAVRADAAGKSASGGEPRIVLQSAEPSAELLATLSGLGGANLRVSPWGESASYGLGEVHFLAFNPDSELGANDTWARFKMVDLVRHAWERANVVALPHGEAGLDDSRVAGVRRVLDPNESTRWTVVVSALLLLLYAALAGPLNFFIAQRRGRPLRALLYLPIWAGLALLGIVVLGVLGKGVVGRARHLTLIEAGAGMAEAAVTRFRGLYGSAADDLTVRAARGSVLDVVGDPDDITRDLVVDRDGLRLERLREKPWEVQVVREDGFVNLGAGVSLLHDAAGGLSIKNRSARDLLSVVVKSPGQGLAYFAKIADGQTVSVQHGHWLGHIAPASSAGSHPLSLDTFRTDIEAHAKGSAAAWDALETVAGSEVDWWPDDVPVLLAQIDGGEGKTQDSGLRLDVDRVLLRVIGYGGVP
ncbi:MAG TPA: hypothetical protein VK745_25525 [Polyangiaceae bacterium]|nr:hypothetical protein [Polyangiaceae bacterium]